MADDETMLEDAWLKKRTKGPEEQSYTSTGSKLLLHPDRLKAFRDNDSPTPIVMHIMPTDTCNFSCTFCSVGNRSGYSGAKPVAGSRPDVLQLYQIRHVVEKLANLGLKGVILSGGGEPTIYRDDDGNDFGDLVACLKENGLEIGLITNGSILDRWKDEISQLTWLRVSLYPPQYGLDAVSLPDIPQDVTLGFSWVVSYGSGGWPNPDDVTEKEILDTYGGFAQSVKDFAVKNGARYVRLLPDCHTYGNDFIKLHNAIDGLVDRFGEPFFHQNKAHKAPENCYLGYFHPVLYPDGKVYPCDSLILNDDDKQTGRRFKSEYAMCEWDEIEKIYNGTVHSLIQDTKQMCPKCVFHSNNTLLDDVYNNRVLIPDVQPDPPTAHRNFV